MELVDYIVIAAIALVVGGALAYIVKAKKSGKRCIGCPDSDTCGKGCAGCNAVCGRRKDD